MIFDPQTAQALGTSGQKLIGKGPNGVDIYAPDDKGVGEGSLNAMYAQSKGSLSELQTRGANFINDANILGDSHATAFEKAQALLGLLKTLTESVLAGSAAIGLVSAGTLAATVPVIGLVAAAAIAVAYVVIAQYANLIDLLTGAQQGRPDTIVEAELKQIPPHMTFKGTPLTAQGIQAAYFASMALPPFAANNRQSGDALLQLSLLLNADRGQADTLYNIVSKVLLDPRWKLSQPGLEELRLYEPARQQLPQRLAAKWKNEFPSAMEWVADLPASSAQPAAYLVLYAAAAVAKGSREAAAFAYGATYQLLLIRAWLYKAAGVPVPDDELASMGFLLDLLSQTPMARVTSTGRLGTVSNPVIPGQLGRAPLVFKDLTYYINYYLHLPPPRKAPAPILQPNVQSQVTRAISGNFPPIG